MSQEELMNAIAEIEREIAILPKVASQKRRLAIKNTIIIESPGMVSVQKNMLILKMFQNLKNGEITGKYVIYRGESGNMEGIQYLNVEEYLKSL